HTVSLQTMISAWCGVCLQNYKPPIVTTDFLYLRFMGYRSIQEKDFERIQIERVLEMQMRADHFKKVEDKRIKLAIVAANNHYAGIGPGTANVFRNTLGFSEAKWQEKEEGQEQEQQPRQYPAHDFKQ